MKKQILTTLGTLMIGIVPTFAFAATNMTMFPSLVSQTSLTASANCGATSNPSFCGCFTQAMIDGCTTAPVHKKCTIPNIVASIKSIGVNSVCAYYNHSQPYDVCVEDITYWMNHCV